MAYTVSHPGAANASGSNTALFLKKFAGEVLTAFMRKNVMMGRQLVRNIAGGMESAQFPATWRATATYFVPDDDAELTGGTVKHGERRVYVDYPLISDHFITQWDQLVNHYDYRSIYSTMQGEAIANTFDTNALIVLALAARASDLFGGDGYSGKQITNANAATNGEVLASVFAEAAQALDEKDVPEDGRYLVLKPAQWYLLSQTTKVLNRDWAGGGSYSAGTLVPIQGISPVKCNHVPSTNIASSPTGVRNTYDGDFSTTIAIGGHMSAIGTVKLMDVSSEAFWRIERQATHLASKMITGTGILRPECAVEVITS